MLAGRAQAQGTFQDAGAAAACAAEAAQGGWGPGHHLHLRSTDVRPVAGQARGHPPSRPRPGRPHSGSRAVSPGWRPPGSHGDSFL